jgi:aspartokinase/homoserine dehydrogenase 1
LWIRNTFNAAHPGTKISASSGSRAAAVKGISGVDKVALVNLEGAGMIGVPGTADRLFGALREAGVSVMLISQGSSEHSICFAVREETADQVRAVVERAFAVELGEGQVQRVGVTKSCAIIAVVGDDMAGMPGSAGRFFGTLGVAGVNVRAIAQGASERNISAVIDAKDMTRAIRAVHSSFYLSAKTVSIGVARPRRQGRFGGRTRGPAGGRDGGAAGDRDAGAVPPADGRAAGPRRRGQVVDRGHYDARQGARRAAQGLCDQRHR